MLFKIRTTKDREAVKAYIDRLAEGRVYNAKIVQHRERRTVDQNGLYWLWLSCISDETGEDKDDLHDYFKQKYLGFRQQPVFPGRDIGAQVFKDISTTRLDTKQFTDYLNKVQVFASAELGIILPDPDDRYWDQFYEQYKNHI